MTLWLSTTRWTDTKVNAIEEVGERVAENKGNFDTDRPNALNYKNLSVLESDIFRIQIEDKEIQYKVMDLSYDTVFPGMADITLRTQNHCCV